MFKKCKHFFKTVNNCDRSWKVQINIYCIAVNINILSITFYALSFRVLLLCGVVLCLVNTLVGISGIAVFAYNTMIRCDPLQAGIIQSPNQVRPTHKLHTCTVSYYDT